VITAHKWDNGIGDSRFDANPGFRGQNLASIGQRLRRGEYEPLQQAELRAGVGRWGAQAEDAA
jgi:hypothetical protein